MQRILDRARRAERRIAKQKAVQEAQRLRDESWERNQNRNRMIRDNTAALRADRKNRKIDWQTGALAPRRDVGELATTYGTFSVYNFQPPERDPDKRVKDWHVGVGDRVVLMRGRDRGKIGTVTATDEERNGVTVEGLNMIDLALPESYKEQQQDAKDVTTLEQQIDVRDVRLVFPLPHPVTGTPRDVVVDKVELMEGEEDDVEGRVGERKEKILHRVIAGTNTILPWPKPAPEEEPEDYENDTLRITVEERTFRPTLIRAPMPLSVIDEVREKYSITRKRHDYEYVQKKEAQEAKKEGRKDLIKTMRTPLQELAALRESKKLAAQQAQELSAEQLAKIGEVIANERAKMQRAVEGRAV